MRLPADEIGHSRRDRLLDDEVVGEARHRTADEDQQRHRQELAAVVVKHLIGAGRTQEIDERADEAQDRDLDQRNDEADRHQCGEIRARPAGNSARNSRTGSLAACCHRDRETDRCGSRRNGTWAGFHRNRGQSRIRKRRRTPRQKRRNGRRNARKATTSECGLSRGRLGVRSRSAQQKERVAANAARIRRRSASRVADGVQIASNRNHSGSLKFALHRSRGPMILARAPQIHESAAEVSS